MVFYWKANKIKNLIQWTAKIVKIIVTMAKMIELLRKNARAIAHQSDGRRNYR